MAHAREARPTEPTTADVVDAVGPRLRALRTRRGTTLAALAERTGISVSTLSRLESGQRKPTLELLLPLARAYQVPLDDLVGAPATGDPPGAPQARAARSPCRDPP
ncbi:helix-turn-helix transcriptional regulator [Curtobacterium sp. MCJR17_043]|uniref:helix-turn-helix domain-containing protein n=1 Tax=Curtobacterium sp. MCJR17_043 TaxID=2175660 RepID=UPI0032E9246D